MTEKFRITLGSFGVPFLTNKPDVPSYMDKFPDKMKPQDVKKVEVSVLDLSDTEDLAEYRRIWAGVGMNTITVVLEDTEWMEASKTWKVLIRWYIGCIMDPNELNELRAKTANSMMT